jgi:hypothetical protein
MSVFVTVLRWLARGSALLIAGAYAFMVVGEFLTPHSGGRATAIEWIGLGLMTATCLGMLLAWRWELAGAALSLASLVAFTMLIRMGHHTVLYVLAIPGTLFLADWLVRRMPALQRANCADGKIQQKQNINHSLCF